MSDVVIDGCCCFVGCIVDDDDSGCGMDQYRDDCDRPNDVMLLMSCRFRFRH